MWKNDVINISNLLLEDNDTLPLDDQKKIADFFVDLVIKLENGDSEALSLINTDPQQLIQQLTNSNQEIKTEAFNNLRSRIGGKLSNQNPLVNRYNMLIDNINKHIWELGEDLKVTKTEDISPYTDMISQLQKIDPSIEAKGGIFQKMGYTVGRGVGFAGKILGTGLLASTLGGLGLSAPAIGAIIGGGFGFLRKSQNTKISISEKLGEVLLSAGLGMVVGYAVDKLTGLLPDTSETPDTLEIN
jgi:hypothetical protein